MNALTSIAFVCGLAALTLSTNLGDTQGNPMKLGSFTVCLNVKDIKASKAFYEKLDFKEVAGDVKKNYVVLQNGTTKIALFQGMLDKNTLTFNPGWTPERETLKDFQDVRELQHILKERGVKLQSEADEKTDGPASFKLVDPDGNPIFFDQYVSKPKR
jgi:catechol 2,3-dioxygenase-like lactoylglutathione lyase family enzyme